MTIKYLNQEKWDLYHKFETALNLADDDEIKKILKQFTSKDLLSMPIVFDIVSYDKVKLLEFLYQNNLPLTYEEHDGTNALHVACGASGSLKSVKFLIENSIITDINRKSSKFGDTPITLAISYGHKEIMNYFKQKYQINSISLTDLEVILDRIRVNQRHSI